MTSHGYAVRKMQGPRKISTLALSPRGRTPDGFHFKRSKIQRFCSEQTNRSEICVQSMPDDARVLGKILASVRVWSMRVSWLSTPMVMVTMCFSQGSSKRDEVGRFKVRRSKTVLQRQRARTRRGLGVYRKLWTKETPRGECRAVNLLYSIQVLSGQEFGDAPSAIKVLSV